MGNSKIEWTEKTLNPLAGCTKVSPGCRHCYAARMAHRLSDNPKKKISSKYKGLTKKLNNGEITWTGKINIDKEALNKIIKKPTMYFVNSMSDLFHPSVDFHFIDSVYEVMGFHKQHIFQVLTKHPERALEYYQWTNIFDAWDYWDHVWIGTSIENQQYADIRIPFLVQIPAKVRWLSCEPLLGSLDFNKTIFGKNPYGSKQGSNTEIGLILSMINWVVVGGESGPGARIMRPDWVRGVRDQCVSMGVPFFFKQWGAYLRRDQREMAGITGGKYFNADYIKGSKGELGRMLDGRTWDEYPERKYYGK